MIRHSENFTGREFACGDGCGFGTREGDVDPALLSHLELVRYIRGDRPIWIASGCRCDEHNEAVGGVDDSAHTRRPGCTAADLGVNSGFDRVEFVAAHVLARAVIAGSLEAAEARAIFANTRPQLGGFGIANGFVHNDVDTVKPRPAAWSY